MIGFGFGAGKMSPVGSSVGSREGCVDGSALGESEGERVGCTLRSLDENAVPIRSRSTSLGSTSSIVVIVNVTFSLPKP